jgi:hypothetical protein
VKTCWFRSARWPSPVLWPDCSDTRHPRIRGGRRQDRLTYSWSTLISGHVGRLGTRDDVVVHQQYMADLDEHPDCPEHGRPHAVFANYGANSWAAIKGYLDAAASAGARPVLTKYTGVLAAADVFTSSIALWLMESIRLDLGYASSVHP